MILGVDKLLQLVKEQKLVENLSERELNNPEGCGFDLRLGEVYKIKGKTFLGIEKRSTVNTKLIAQYDPNKPKTITIKPGEYFVIKTIEKVNLPLNLAAIFRPRSTLYRSGVMVNTGNVAPGYCGELTFGLVNQGNSEVEIELGARIVHVLFFEVGGKTNTYRGQWQGGRVSTEGRTETQV